MSPHGRTIQLAAGRHNINRLYRFGVRRAAITVMDTVVEVLYRNSVVAVVKCAMRSVGNDLVAVETDTVYTRSRCRCIRFSLRMRCVCNG